jgi:hypothetical protein
LEGSRQLGSTWEVPGMAFRCRNDNYADALESLLWEHFQLTLLVQAMKLKKRQTPEKINSETKFSGLIGLSLLYYVLKIRQNPPAASAAILLNSTLENN